MSDAPHSQLSKPQPGYPGIETALTALSLMHAAPFDWVAGDFKWSNENLVAQLFQARLDDIPTTLDALITRLDDDGRAARRAAIRTLTWDGALYRVHYQARQFNGELCWIEERGQRLSGKDKEPTHIRGVIRDISAQKKAEETAVYKAVFDPLTGLWNEGRMIEALDWLISSSQRYDHKGAFFALQVVNIDAINETYGFDAGDRLLVDIAKRLELYIRAPDLTARLSGHGFEGVVFGIAMGQCDLDGQAAMAQRLIGQLSDQPFPSPNGDIYASFAISAVHIPQHAETGKQALHFSRIALDYSLSREGLFISFDPEMEDRAARNRRAPITAQTILEALNGRTITLAYQPIVHARSRTPHHYECLLRLRREDGEIISAGSFIMAAEKLGLVHFLDRRALDIATKTLIDNPEIILALNVSAATVTNDLAAADYIKALKALGPLAERIIVELTETVALDDPAKASGFSAAVRALGCTFAIDDFGAGYTTFQNLMAIEADEIKLDGSFITDLAVSPHKQTFVRMMVDLAQTFNVKTVAEFVNSREDADLLTRLGVDYLQGYMFGIPSPAPTHPENPKAKPQINAASSA